MEQFSVLWTKVGCITFEFQSELRKYIHANSVKIGDLLWCLWELWVVQ